ncbi:uncharacterized protein ACA1_215290 [Acanthamoeba castellanii str. Neff]|uniref:Clu domain-containing protein n=1 Tax=Acanthamoeba castellanii (strain ATCC 30010 / Neff) TaxID=1257118 RepID=L8GR23_ACACF|nr:uncharacterized protein ACA1_215290 [Acanthamoeba castellanii str. Neff]ELR15078.1 hypothetical protein ACA1_215290 [Acanthamoeba castellanii str. Neff]
MYGGEERSDEFAVKASGHELKSLIMMHRACIPDLHCPLMCTVDYRGFRLVCCSAGLDYLFTKCNGLRTSVTHLDLAGCTLDLGSLNKISTAGLIPFTKASVKALALRKSTAENK